MSCTISASHSSLVGEDSEVEFQVAVIRWRVWTQSLKRAILWLASRGRSRKKTCAARIASQRSTVIFPAIFRTISDLDQEEQLSGNFSFEWWLQFNSSMLASSCLHNRLTARSTARRKLCMPCCASGSKCRRKVGLISSRWLIFIAGSTLPNLRGKGASTPRAPPPPPLLSSRTLFHSREPFLSSCAASGTHVCLEHKLWLLLRFVPCETRESLLCPILLNKLRAKGTFLQRLQPSGFA